MNIVDKIIKAGEIVKEYTGTNPKILELQYRITRGRGTLSDFDVKYVFTNKDYIEKEVNKTFKISAWYGETLKEKQNLEFLPVKLKIIKVIGEMENSFHCYVQYRLSQKYLLLTYVPKKAIWGDILADEIQDLNIDFTPYDKEGREVRLHQKIGINFLLNRRKAIIADDMGLGKSMTCILASMIGEYKRILVICPASLKSNWEREISIYNDKKDIIIVDGSKWQEAKYTIINYDILHNFYEIPYEENEDGKIVKSRKKVNIIESLKNSQLFQSQFDLVIIDECHNLSVNSSSRFQIIKDFLSKSKPDSVFFVTGAIIANDTMNLYNILTLLKCPVSDDYNYYVSQFCSGKKVWNKYLRKEIIIPGEPSNLEELSEKIKHLYIRRLKEEIGGVVEKRRNILYYDLTPEEEKEYNELTEKYLEEQLMLGRDLTDYKTLIESTLLNEYTAVKMVKNTIVLGDKIISNGDKLVIIGCFDEEILQLKEYFGDKSVIYNGKMTNKQKDLSEKQLMENDKIKIIIGNIKSIGVGLNLTVAHHLILNSFLWVPSYSFQGE
ncbi:RNA polymerase-associated protein RapA, partial [termite gut metagenome]